MKTEVAEAERLIHEHMGSFPAVERTLSETVGAVLRETVQAERDQPPFDRVTMDGIAISYADWENGQRRYRVIGTQGAGAPPLKVDRAGDCVEIMTGAVLPDGTDTIVPIERVSMADGDAVVEESAVAAARQFVHQRASDRVAGSSLLSSGNLIGPPEMAVLASAGRSTVRVTEAPRIAVVSTGDELVDPGEPIEPYQIRSSNDRAIEATLARQCQARVTRVTLRDNPVLILESVVELHEENDALILSGGVSMGQYDFVPGVLERLGVELVFHRIEQRPGRPMWFGISYSAKPVFALPGNPVSTLVCLTRYVVPALHQAMGRAPGPVERVSLTEEVKFSADLVYFLPVRIHSDDAGTLLADPCPTNTSGDFVSLAGTDGFVELPKGRDTYPAGTVARLFRW